MYRKIIPCQVCRYIIITILIIIAYFPTFSGKFIVDDKTLIENNPFITEAHSITAYFGQEDGIVDVKDIGEYHTGYYRPLINMTYRLDYLLWGMDATGYRVTNLILHILCCFMLLSFISLFLNGQTAFWAALIFAIHPVNTEAVAFIVARNNIIGSFFVLAALYSYIIAWERKNYFKYIVSLFLFTGAIFSKEFGLMVIPLLFIYQRTLSKQRYGLSRELISYIPFIIIALIYLLLRKAVTGSLLTPANMEGIWSRVYFTPFLIFYNLKLIISPHGLHFFYLEYPKNIFNWYTTISSLLILLIFFTIWRLRNNRLLLFSILAFLICIFPSINIIPHSATSLVTMRWLYLPMVFLLIGVGIIIRKAIVTRWDITLSILIIIMAYLGAYTYILNKGLWHDDDTLFKQEVFGFNNYFFATDIGDRYFHNKQYLEAEKYFKIAIEEFPYRENGYIHYSALMIETGRPADAISILNKAKKIVMIHHVQGEWFNNMGIALSQVGEKEKGLDCLKKAVVYAPQNPIFWLNLGGAYGMIGEFQNSIDALKKGIGISPSSIQLWTNLALSYINLKDYKTAVSVLESLPEQEGKDNSEVMRLLKLAREGLIAN